MLAALVPLYNAGLFFGGGLRHFLKGSPKLPNLIYESRTTT